MFKICRPSAGSRAAYAQVTANVLFLRRRLNISCARIERQMTDIVSTLSLGDLKLGDKSNKYSFVMSVCPNLI